MKQFINTIVLFLIAGLLFISTGGINLYVHYCACEDQFYTSAVPFGDCSHHEYAADACCQKNGTNNSCNLLHHGKKNCCTTHQVYLKLSTDLTFQANHDPLPLPCTEAAIPKADPDLLRCGPVCSGFSADTSPVTLSGKSLVTFLHQLRLEAPVA